MTRTELQQALEKHKETVCRQTSGYIAVKALERYQDHHWPDCSIVFTSTCDCDLPSIAQQALEQIKEVEGK